MKIDESSDKVEGAKTNTPPKMNINSLLPSWTVSHDVGVSGFKER